MTALELLAPARDLSIGIAAVDCGADAVYIAGPGFGARKAAANSIEDIRTLCNYAHRFGVRIYVTFNTIIYENELEDAGRMLREICDAGVDALIVQDPAVRQLVPEGTILHASTQCAIRTPEDAIRLESMGYGRLVLERQLSLEQIKAIRSAVGTELEFFVHGALCVCYSGQCYLSEYLAGRSANRGECIQACRSLYDLEDGRGKKLVRNAPLLSLKDLCLEDRLEDLAQAGICSFKIEGRLKSISYVRNVVRKYSLALDELVRKYPDRYCRSAFGSVRGGFLPDLGKAFNRGYTELFLDGTKGEWASGDAATSLGERIGTVRSISQGRIILQAEGTVLHNGDGFCVILPDGRVEGFRADVCEGNTIRCTVPEGLKAGMSIYRNYDSTFEKTLEAGSPLREMDVRLSVRSNGMSIRIDAISEDGRKVSVDAEGESAKDPARAAGTLRDQLSKRSGIYSFRLENLPEKAPFLPISKINELRRSLADSLDKLPTKAKPIMRGSVGEALYVGKSLSYKWNIANSIDRDFFSAHGAETLEDAYELNHRPGAELMRSRYCIRHELGLCPKQSPGTRPEPLFLINNGRRLRLDFDCTRCEMSVSEA